MKVEKSVVVLAPEPCESEQNWLSYDFFENTYPGDSDGDDTKSLHQLMHQNTLFWRIHNLMSFAWIHMILVPMRPHFHSMYLQKK